ncbi:MAG: 30S ribosomal protein S17 [Candidatus Altiarchaeota archaeon]
MTDKKKKEEECGDPKCPIHGGLAVRGGLFEGQVVSDKMDGTVIVQRDFLEKDKKYERYLKSRSRIPAHNPACINAKSGDSVTIGECRRLSKSVSFVVLEKKS